MKPIAVLSFLFIAASLGVMLCSRTAESQEEGQTSPESRINRLLIERRDILRELLDAVKLRYESGETSVNSVFHAQNVLIEADLELAQTDIERMGIHDMRVKNLRNFENALEQQHSQGEATVEQLLASKAARMQAEIEFLREQVTGD